MQQRQEVLLVALSALSAPPTCGRTHLAPQPDIIAQGEHGTQTARTALRAGRPGPDHLQGNPGFHYGKHHQTYVTNLNNLIKGTEFENASLEEIVKKPAAASSTTPPRCGTTPSTGLACPPNGGGRADWRAGWAINAKWGSFDEFKGVQRRGRWHLWFWLGLAGEGGRWFAGSGVHQQCRHPLTTDKTPLLTCDVWEHAYYIDYRNSRPNYLEGFWKLVNWDVVAKHFA